MTYKIVFQPRNRIHGATPGSAEYETAKEAYKAADNLSRSDEKVEITKDGYPIGMRELKLDAESETVE